MMSKLRVGELVSHCESAGIINAGKSNIKFPVIEVRLSNKIIRYSR